MKVSKRQLKRIIKEERVKLLKEMNHREPVWSLLERIQDMGVSETQVLEYLLNNWMPTSDAQQALSDYLTDLGGDEEEPDWSRQ